MNQHFTLLIRLSVKYFKYSLEDLNNKRKRALKKNIDYECSLLLTTIWVEMVSEGALLFEVYKTTILKT